jgi:hypothetical protein
VEKRAPRIKRGKIMKKLVLLGLAVLLVSSCGWLKKEEKPAVSIGKVRISAGEFQRAFEASGFARDGGKKGFLETFISRKLILLEAERLGLDKDPEFLRGVQDFWEQSLLKLALSKKIKELVSAVDISEEEVQSYYRKNKEQEFADKEFEQAHDRIKWQLLRDKQETAIEDWADSLRKDARIIIDYKLLGIEKN